MSFITIMILYIVILNVCRVDFEGQLLTSATVSSWPSPDDRNTKNTIPATVRSLILMDGHRP